MEPTPVRPYTVAAPIRTERLTLRLMAEGDLEDIYAYQSLEQVCRYLLYEPRTREQVAEKIAMVSQSTTLASDGDYLQLALELPGTVDSPARVIGDSFFKLASVADAQGEIGWTTHPDFMGRGYASEAARAMLGIAFGELGLHRVIANLDPRNDASIALCLRLGMREEAHFIGDMWFKGHWADTGIYAILQDEWTAGRELALAAERMRARASVRGNEKAPVPANWNRGFATWARTAACYSAVRCPRRRM